MRIAQVAPLDESVPPAFSGEVQALVSYLTEELIRLGHQVTLFASGDSLTTARLEAVWPEAIRSRHALFNFHAPLSVLLERAFFSGEDFDLIHSHVGLVAFPMARRSGTPVLTTVHGRVDLPEVAPVYAEFREQPLVAISNAQRRPLPWANWAATIYPGLPRDLHACRLHPGQYLACLGRISPESALDQAIKLAQHAGLPLYIAGRVEAVDQDYFRAEIEPLLSDPHVQYLGELSGLEKSEFLANAYALVAPCDWREPFSLALIEALACGTPVLAYRWGANPEIIEDGVTGYLCDNYSEMVAAVKEISAIDRSRCRQAFEEYFTAERMAQDYLELYERVTQHRRLLGHRRAW